LPTTVSFRWYLLLSYSNSMCRQSSMPTSICAASPPRRAQAVPARSKPLCLGAGSGRARLDGRQVAGLRRRPIVAHPERKVLDHACAVPARHGHPQQVPAAAGPDCQHDGACGPGGRRRARQREACPLRRGPLEGLPSSVAGTDRCWNSASDVARGSPTSSSSSPRSAARREARTATALAGRGTSRTASPRCRTQRGTSAATSARPPAPGPALPPAHLSAPRRPETPAPSQGPGQGARTQRHKVVRVAALGCQLDLAQQLHLNALVLHLLARHVGHLDLRPRPRARRPLHARGAAPPAPALQALAGAPRAPRRARRPCW